MAPVAAADGDGTPRGRDPGHEKARPRRPGGARTLEDGSCVGRQSMTVAVMMSRRSMSSSSVTVLPSRSPIPGMLPMIGRR